MDDRSVFLQGGGDVGALMRTMKWEDSPLSDPEIWNDTLKTAVGISLNSGFPIAIYWGKDFTLLYNDAYTPILGARHPGALGRPAHVVWEENWQGIKNEFQSVADEGKSIRVPDSLFIMHRNGYPEECYFDYTLSPIMCPDGTVGGIFSAVTETTYKKVSERRGRIINQLVLLQQKTQTFSQSLESCKVILKEAVQDIPFFLIYTKNIANEYTAILANGVEQPYESVKWKFEHLIKTPNGALHVERISDYLSEPITGIYPEHCCEALIVPLKHEQAAVSGFLVAGLSPRKRFDNDYESFIKNTGTQIGGILNNAFSWDEYLELEAEKDNLLGIISHELKTPITSIKAYAQLAVRLTIKDEMPQTSQLLGKLAEQAEKLNILVKDLLEGTNLNLGKIAFDNEWFYFDDLISDIVGDARVTTESRQFHMNLLYNRRFYGDRTRIAQVIRILLSNAIKYSPAQTTITLSSEFNGGAVIFSISDQGIGISPSEHQKIFERFYRVVNPKLYTYPGIGLGLFIAKAIVRYIGGKIWVKSEEGAGSTFHFSLPYQEA